MVSGYLSGRIRHLVVGGRNAVSTKVGGEMELQTWIGSGVGTHGGDERSKTRKLFRCEP